MPSAVRSTRGWPRSSGRAPPGYPPPAARVKPRARAAPHPSLVAGGIRRARGRHRLHADARRLVRYRERWRGLLTPPPRRPLHVLRSGSGRLAKAGWGGWWRSTSPVLHQPPEPPQPASRVDSQLHIVWMGTAMVDAGLGYRPHAMHTEVT